MTSNKCRLFQIWSSRGIHTETRLSCVGITLVAFIFLAAGSSTSLEINRRCKLTPSFTFGHYYKNDIYEYPFQVNDDHDTSGIHVYPICAEPVTGHPDETSSDIDTNTIQGVCFTKAKASCYGHLTVIKNTIPDTQKERCSFIFADMSITQTCREFRNHQKARRVNIKYHRSIDYDFSNVTIDSLFVDQLLMQVRRYTIHFYFNFTVDNNIFLEAGFTDKEVAEFLTAKFVVESTTSPENKRVIIKTKPYTFPPYPLMVYSNGKSLFTNFPNKTSMVQASHTFMLPQPTGLQDVIFIYRINGYDYEANLEDTRDANHNYKPLVFDGTGLVNEFETDSEYFNIMNQTFTMVTVTAHVPANGTFPLLSDPGNTVDMFFIPRTMSPRQVDEKAIGDAEKSTGKVAHTTVTKVKNLYLSPYIRMPLTHVDYRHDYNDSRCDSQRELIDTWKDIYDMALSVALSPVKAHPIKQTKVNITMDNMTVDIIAKIRGYKDIVIRPVLPEENSCYYKRRGYREDVMKLDLPIVQTTPEQGTDSPLLKTGAITTNSILANETISRGTWETSIRDETTTTQLPRSFDINSRWLIMIILGTVSCVTSVVVTAATLILCITKRRNTRHGRHLEQIEYMVLSLLRGKL